MSARAVLGRIAPASIMVLMIAQSTLGLLFHDRYRDAAWIKATWFGNDWVTLVVAVPLLGCGLLLARRGSVRGAVLCLGVVAFALYNYAYYLFGAALNEFFPLYLAAFLMSAVTLFRAPIRPHVALKADSVGQTIATRIAAAYLACVGFGLTVVWVSIWAAYVFEGRPTPIDPEAFKVVAALDIVLMVPWLVCGAVLLWRHQPAGSVISSIAGVQASLYLLVLSVNSVVAIHRGLARAPGEVPIWGTLSVVTTVVTLVLLFNIPPRRRVD